MFLKISLDVRTVGFMARKYSNQNWTDVMIHKSRVKLINYSFDVRTVGFERFSDYKKKIESAKSANEYKKFV